MNYSNTAIETTLQSGLTADTTTVIVTAATGYPAAPFAIVVGTVPTHEVMLVTAKAGTTFTVTRGYDGTTARTHSSGAAVYHGMIADDLAERVRGTGTAGRAAFWSDVDTLSGYATSLYWDAVNSRLGIGIDAPLVPLHISNSNRLSGGTSGTAQINAVVIDSFAIDGTSNIISTAVSYTPPTQPSGTRTIAALRPTITAGSAFSYGLNMRASNVVAAFSGSGTLSGTTNGQYAQVQHTSTGTLSNANVVSGLLQCTSTGVITTGTAFRALQPISTAANNYGTTYGLYIEDQVPDGGASHQSGTANGIYQAGTTTTNTFKGPSIFDGKLTANGGTAGIPRTFTLGYISGGATVANDVGMNINLDVNMTLQSVRLYAKTPPVGSVLTVDIKRSTDSGATYTTIFSTLPTIAAAARVGGSAAVFSVTSVSAGDIFRVDVTTVGSGTAGSDITVQINGVTR